MREGQLARLKGTPIIVKVSWLSAAHTANCVLNDRWLIHHIPLADLEELDV